MIILHLEITDYLYSIGATHYYGHIVFPFKEKYGQLGLPERVEENVELGFELTRTDAEALNKKERSYAPDHRCVYKVGERSTRFDSPKLVEIAGIKYYNEKLKEKYPLLVLGSSGVVEPQKIIGYNFESKPEIKLINQINKIVEKYHYNEDCDTEHNLALYKKWKPLWKKLTGEKWS
jgi:hypothetical protein